MNNTMVPEPDKLYASILEKLYPRPFCFLCILSNRTFFCAYRIKPLFSQRKQIDLSAIII